MSLKPKIITPSSLNAKNDGGQRASNPLTTVTAGPKGSNSNGINFTPVQANIPYLNKVRRDLVLPILSGLLVGAWELFYDKENKIRALKVGFQQFFAQLIAEFIVGAFPSWSASSIIVEEYGVDVMAALLFGLMERLIYKEKGLKDFFMNALLSFFATVGARYIESPLMPYLPSFVTNFRI